MEIRKMSYKEYRGLQEGKYKNRKTVVNGETLDSRREAFRYAELLLMEQAGAIKDLRRQVKYELIPKQEGERACFYVADFVYEEEGKTVVEDCKGFRTDVYKLKRKLMLYRYGIRIKET